MQSAVATENKIFLALADPSRRASGHQAAAAGATTSASKAPKTVARASAMRSFSRAKSSVPPAVAYAFTTPNEPA